MYAEKGFKHYSVYSRKIAKSLKKGLSKKSQQEHQENHRRAKMYEMSIKKTEMEEFGSKKCIKLNVDIGFQQPKSRSDNSK